MRKKEHSLRDYRCKYSPVLPAVLRDLHRVHFEKVETFQSAKGKEELEKLFPKTIGQPFLEAKEGSVHKSPALRVGVVLSGGQAPGGHNVIAGLFDALKKFSQDNELFGFLGGPSGIIQGSFEKITSALLDPYRNTGGFDLIGSGRTKIETAEQLTAALETVKSLKLDGIVIIGGDDSNTNAAILAEYFLSQNCDTKVIGVPKTIDGDLKNAYIPISFGFDTACKIYSEMIGNIAKDALSAKKYYHFIKLMGRSASNVTLECALATHPTMALIAEEIAEKKMTLSQITKQLADLICKRAESKKNYGVILIPEGLIEFIPEMKGLIAELNQMGSSLSGLTCEQVEQKLTASSKSCFQALPMRIQEQLLLDRDPHGNVQVSLIETERLFMETVTKELEERKKNGTYKGKFSPLQHFFGYEGRSGFPSNFDCNYCYALGAVAALLIEQGFTGYMSSLRDLTKPASDWKVGAVPITMMMHLEKRHGVFKPVIEKALVDLKGKPFAHFQSQRDKWIAEDAFVIPGPIQFFGDKELTEILSWTLELEC